MEVKTCKKCRRMFNYISGVPLCPNCRERLEEKFRQVKEYLQEHNNASIADVAEECDVEEKQLRQWIREERLVFAKGVDTGVVCERCGRPIPTGRYCEKCKFEVVTDLKSSFKATAVTPPPAETSHENKMRYFRV